MNKYSFTDNANRYERISKSTARKLWLSGAENIAACPNKLVPGYAFALHMTIGNDQYHREYGFDNWVSNFEHYNCSYETGYYAAFYKVTPL